MVKIIQRPAKVYHYRLPHMHHRIVCDCTMCGNFLSGNGFSYCEGIIGFCTRTRETELSQYKFKIIENPDIIPDWCPLPDQSEGKTRGKII
jgi:hypothetical protein